MNAGSGRLLGALVIASTAAAVISASLLMPRSARGAEPASVASIIETRQAGFKKMGAALKALNDQVKAGSADAAVLTRAAAAIAAGAAAQVDWFPTGSGPESGSKTDAMPGIWTERARFDGLAQKLVVESKLLGERIEAGDQAAITSQVKAVGAACSACHKSFRAD